MLRSANVSRVHIHHLLWFEFDTRAMILRLGVPFDVTIHDNYVLCPQLNMLPQATSFYCGGPDIATCNACIAVSPSANQARDILSWRLKYAWQLTDADRVICPSEDMKQRLERFVPAERGIVVPHEGVAASNWPLTLPKLAKAPLRVVLPRACWRITRARGSLRPVVETAPKGLLDVHCIGELEGYVSARGGCVLVTATGRYREEELAGLIRKIKPHVVWLPSVAPESYSYTLTAAIDAGLPIVATRFGAFPERLAGRPYTWLVDYDVPTETWLDTFRNVRDALKERPEAGLPGRSRANRSQISLRRALCRSKTDSAAAVDRAWRQSGDLDHCRTIRLRSLLAVRVHSSAATVDPPCGSGRRHRGGGQCRECSCPSGRSDRYPASCPT